MGLLVAAGCKPSSNTQSTEKQSQQETLETADADSVAEVEHRFAVFSPALGVMLRDLGYEDSIVGRHNFDIALSNSIPIVGSHIDVDYEMLLTVKPTDIFFEINASEIPPRLSSLAEQQGWTIWSYKLESLDDIATTLDDLYLKLVGFKSSDIEIDPLTLEFDPSARFNTELPSAKLVESWSPMGSSANGAGRMLLIASVDPPGAMGPGSFHAQMIERLGVSSAISEGGMWQELDYEDIVHLNPDSILVFSPRQPNESDLIGEPEPMSWDEISNQIGGISELPISAVESKQIAVVEHPLGLLPSSSLAQVADQIAEILHRWHNNSAP
jgi:ABC-type Fe3+-hydroxamate transport system substrate-binding protein